MKQLESGGPGAGWNRDLVRQLGFIKKNLRYPIGRYTVWPIVLLSATLPAVALMVYIVLFTRSTSHYKPAWLPLVLIWMILVPGILAARRYLRTLRFIAVPSGHSVAGNMVLLQQFLGANHFAIGRHPEAPEVFQIISRSISALNDEREVVIFIADDGRILINSHFTQNRFKSAIGAPHYRQVAMMLAEWIRNEAAGSATDLRAF